MTYTPFLSNLCGARSINNLLPCDAFNLLMLTLQEWKAGQKTPSVTAVRKIHKCEMYTTPTWKEKNRCSAPASDSQACIPAYYFLFSMAMWSLVSQAEIAIKGADVQLWCAYLSMRNCMEPSYSFITSFLHAGVVLWDTLIEAVSKVAKYHVHCMLGFMQFLGTVGLVQRDGYFEAYPSTGINSIRKAVVEVMPM